MSNYLAVDVGAESGRVIVASLEHGRLSLEEVYRFANGGVQVGPHLYWDVLHLWHEIKRGLRSGIAKGNKRVLEAGMVINVEVPYYEIGCDGFQVEYTLFNPHIKDLNSRQN